MSNCVHTLSSAQKQQQFVSRMLNTFGLLESISQKKPRTCLRCGNLFNSKDSGNRICGDCHEYLDELETPGTMFEANYDQKGILISLNKIMAY